MMDYSKGPLDVLKEVFIKALYHVYDDEEYDRLIYEWNKAVEYLQKVLEIKKGK